MEYDYTSKRVIYIIANSGQYYNCCSFFIWICYQFPPCRLHTLKWPRILKTLVPFCLCGDRHCIKLTEETSNEFKFLTFSSWTLGIQVYMFVYVCSSWLLCNWGIPVDIAQTETFKLSKELQHCSLRKAETRVHSWWNIVCTVKYSDL